MRTFCQLLSSLFRSFSSVHVASRMLTFHDPFKQALASLLHRHSRLSLSATASSAALAGSHWHPLLHRLTEGRWPLKRDQRLYGHARGRKQCPGSFRSPLTSAATSKTAASRRQRGRHTHTSGSVGVHHCESGRVRLAVDRGSLADCTDGHHREADGRGRHKTEPRSAWLLVRARKNVRVSAHHGQQAHAPAQRVLGHGMPIARLLLELPALRAAATAALASAPSAHVVATRDGLDQYLLWHARV
jgi:hypothetical protein